MERKQKQLRFWGSEHTLGASHKKMEGKKMSPGEEDELSETVGAE